MATSPFCTPLEAAAAIARGELVVVVDDEDRENEGDLIGCAELATAEKLAFMVRWSSGVVCVPAPAARLATLELAALESEYRDPNCTAFCMPVDYRHGTTTGVSAADRAATIVAMASSDAAPSDFFRPGHVFPLRSAPGGVLERRGHTEACVDLCRLAGCTMPVGYIAEMCNDDGTMSRLPELTAFCDEHGLLLLTIEALAAHRQLGSAAAASS
jgi:3,4-dihydroxy-2-butanone 4-phosphate synthase